MKYALLLIISSGSLLGGDFFHEVFSREKSRENFLANEMRNGKDLMGKRIEMFQSQKRPNSIENNPTCGQADTHSALALATIILGTASCAPLWSNDRLTRRRPLLAWWATVGPLVSLTAGVAIAIRGSLPDDNRALF